MKTINTLVSLALVSSLVACGAVSKLRKNDSGNDDAPHQTAPTASPEPGSKEKGLSIEDYTSFAGFTMGDTKEQMMSKLGTPIQSSTSDNPKTEGYYYFGAMDSVLESAIQMTISKKENKIKTIVVPPFSGTKESLLEYFKAKGLDESKIRPIGMSRSAVIDMLGRPANPNSEYLRYEWTTSDDRDIWVTIDCLKSRDYICSSITVNWWDL
jgi:outer membrane protein assembly factor BamE (lipoprotein component of BamABCDE complex)